MSGTNGTASPDLSPGIADQVVHLNGFEKGVRNLYIDRVAAGRQVRGMGRPDRTDVGRYVCHLLNRANARMKIFEHRADWVERIATKIDLKTALSPPPDDGRENQTHKRNGL